VTHEEAKKAWFAKVPVVSGGIKYTKINALIYKLSDKNEIIVSAELLDKCGNSVTITKIDNVEVANDNIQANG